jgi:mRNA-degrading endonuclease RelE of RelBE toxin-antitoxin system
MQIPLPIVIHPSGANFLQSLQDVLLAKQIQKCLSKVKNLQFDSGLRLKKLKGIDHNLWEVRIDRKSRLIFCFYKSYYSNLNKELTYIAVQDIFLEHDDVKTARELFPDENWINLKEIINAQNDPEVEENNISNIQKDIEDEILELEISEIKVDQLLSNIQWKVIERDEDWDDLIFNKDRDLPLRLSKEEFEAATYYGNLLLSGFAGTGKTTVGLYRLLKSLQDFNYYYRRLYVAYNPLLVNYAQEQFYRLTNKNNISSGIFHFNTIKNLCLDIFKTQGKNLNQEDIVTFQTFEQMYRLPQRRIYPSNLVWQEIRGLIKGSQLSLSHKLFSQTEYLNLGRGRAVTIPIIQRAEIYQIALWYQKKLDRQNLFDEIDLAREALKFVREKSIYKYQIIVCDEVQDLTEIQIELLLSLVVDGGQILFTGDTNQMISPSGFRWEDLSTRFYENNLVIKEKTLKHNFRSINSLSYLAYQFLKVRSRLLDEKFIDDDIPSPQHHQFGGRLIQGSVNELLSSLSYLQSGDAILVRTEEERTQLKQKFNSQLVFTIEEAKGLEFDCVFILNFFQIYPDLWHQVLSQSHPLNLLERPKLRLELNLLYVAITRPRIYLYFWEEKTNELWQQDEFKSVILPFNIELLIKERELDNSNWFERGEYYFKAEFYPQAMECFEKAGALGKYKEAKAKYHHQKNEYLEAAYLYKELEKWELAAKLFEKKEQWKEAIFCWRKINNREQMLKCWATLFDSQKKYDKAGKIWQELGDLYKAGISLEKAGKWNEALSCWNTLGNKYCRQQEICRAKILETQGKWEEAATKWHLLERFNDERECWFKSDNLKKKAEYLVKDYSNRKEWAKLAEQYEILENFILASENWKKAEQEYQENNQDQEANNCRYRIILNLQKEAEKLHSKKDYITALSIINDALKIDNKCIDSLLQKIAIYFDLEYYEQLVTECDNLLKLEPNCFKAREYKAIAYLYLAKQELSQSTQVKRNKSFSSKLTEIINDTKNLIIGK